MKIYRRDTGSYEEEQEFQAGLLRVLYETVPGRVLLKAAIHPAASRLYALYPVGRNLFYGQRTGKILCGAEDRLLLGGEGKACEASQKA